MSLAGKLKVPTPDWAGADTVDAAVESDVARLLARALVQQFLSDAVPLVVPTQVPMLSLSKPTRLTFGRPIRAR